jgi:hypothetical protein
MSNTHYYEYENEESIDMNLKCVICNEPFIDPVETECHHLFCCKCLNRWIENDKSTCPTCRKIISKNSLKSIEFINFISMINQILVKCLLCHQSNIQRGNFQDHINKICHKMIVNCTAKDINCPWTGLRQELQNHLNTCVYESLRDQIEQQNREDQQKVDNHSIISETTHNRQPIFEQRNSNGDGSFMCVNPELQNVSGRDIVIATREIILNGQCRYLNLFGHQISPENILYITSALPNNTSLKILELGQCSIGDLGVQFLGTTLAMYSSLQCLDLYDNSITDIGVHYLANMLRLNQSLSRLKLAYNQITNHGIKILINVIVNYNCTINHLSLKGNQLINDLCICEIIYLIKYNKSLKTLNLEDCNLSWYTKKSIQLSQTIYSSTDLQILL